MSADHTAPIDTGEHNPMTLDDLAPGVIEGLTFLGDEYGPAGVIAAARMIWPDADNEVTP